MNETQLLTYILNNWPSFISGAIIATVLYRLTSFNARLEKLEKKLNRQIKLCIDADPLRAKRLLSDDE